MPVCVRPRLWSMTFCLWRVGHFSRNFAEVASPNISVKSCSICRQDGISQDRTVNIMVWHYHVIHHSPNQTVVEQKTIVPTVSRQYSRRSTYHSCYVLESWKSCEYFRELHWVMNHLLAIGEHLLHLLLYNCFLSRILHQCNGLTTQAFCCWTLFLSEGVTISFWTTCNTVKPLQNTGFVRPIQVYTILCYKIHKTKN